MLRDKLKERPSFSKSTALDCCPSLTTEAGEPLFIRMMSGAQRREYDRKLAGIGKDKVEGMEEVQALEIYHDINAWLVCRTLVDASGTRQFHDGDEALVAESIDDCELKAISEAAQKFCKLRAEDVEGEQKNLPSPTSSDS